MTATTRDPLLNSLLRLTTLACSIVFLPSSHISINTGWPMQNDWRLAAIIMRFEIGYAWLSNLVGITDEQ